MFFLVIMNLGFGERRYSFYSFSTSALDGVIGQRHAQAALLPQSRSVHKRLEKKSFRLYRGSILNHTVVQPVTRHYSD
jgi:hypothetical protein